MASMGTVKWGYAGRNLRLSRRVLDAEVEVPLNVLHDFVDDFREDVQNVVGVSPGPVKITGSRGIVLVCRYQPLGGSTGPSLDDAVDLFKQAGWTFR